MNKLIAKLLIFLLLIKVITPIFNIGEVFAVTNIWDFNDVNNYTLSTSDDNIIRINNGIVRLPYHLEHLGSITDDILKEARRVIVKGDYAFVSSYNADSLVSIDISDPTAPIIVDVISDGDDNGNGGTINLDGPRGLTFTGNYLYISSYASDNINIIDIQNPTNLTFIKELNEDDDDKLKLNGANDVAIYGDHLYVSAYGDDALNIFDISTLDDPVFKKEFDDAKLDGINRINIIDQYAYAVMEANNSFAVIDLTNQDEEGSMWDPKDLIIVGEVNDGDDGALLNGASGITTISGSLVFIASKNSDALEVIDISDPTDPIHTGSIVDDGGDIKLDSNRQVIIYKNFALNAVKTSDSVEVIDIQEPTQPVHESFLKRSDEILLNGANDIYNSGSIFYIASNTDDALEILKLKYSTNSPYIISNNSYNYTGSINSFSDIVGGNNEGIVSYQISFDDGNNWYYNNGNEWLQTNSGSIYSNTSSEINDNLYAFNKLNKAGTGSFTFKAFLNSNGEQKVELKNVIITTIEGPTDIINPVFWYDGQDIDGDGDSSNEPNNGDEINSLIDKFNGFDTNSESGKSPTYSTGEINNFPNIQYDGSDDYYTIGDDNLINTDDFYEKTFSIVFKTSDDIDTFQNIYEQGGTTRGYNIQIEDGRLYAGVFNTKEWEEGEQYKFVDLGKIKSNETYYLTMIQESNNDKTLKVYLDSYLVGDLGKVDYQRSHGGDIGLGFINGNTIKASDNSSIDEPSYFKGNIGEFLSRNHALDDNERNGVDMYLKNKWGLDFKILPIITGKNIVDNQLFINSLGLELEFYYEDGEGGEGIDDTTAILNLFRIDGGVWSEDLSGSLLDLGKTNISTSTGTYYATGSWHEGYYKAVCTISNLDGNSATKDIYFSVDSLGIVKKIFHYDLQDPNGDNKDTEPNNGDLLVGIKDKMLGFDAYQTDTDSQGVYYESGVINPPYPGLILDGTNDFYDIDNQNIINTSSFKEKSFSIIFKTGDDIDTFQNIFEQGGGSRGYAIQVQSGTIFAGAWNNEEWADGDQYKTLTGIIESNTIYSLTMVQDSTDSDLANTRFEVFIDGNSLGSLNNIDFQRSHPGKIAIGQISGGAIQLSDNSSSDDGHYFKGSIGELISWNHALTLTEEENIQLYLKNKWDLDKINPIITKNNFASGSLLAGGNHDLIFEFDDNDGGVGINISSANISIDKWDSDNSTWDTLSDVIGTGTISETGASYPTLDLDYGKYLIGYYIEDKNGNNTHTGYILYIDKPIMTISTGSIDIGELNDSSNSFANDITITVKTVGAGFDIQLKRNKSLEIDSAFIPYYDGSVGFGYDKNDDGGLSDFDNDIIGQENKNINTDGNYNIYSYTVSIGSIIEYQQAGGEYSGKIDFGIKLDY